MTLDFGGLSKVGGGKPSADLDFGGLTRADGSVAEPMTKAAAPIADPTLDAAVKQYPVIKDFGGKVIKGTAKPGDRRKLEFWPAGEEGDEDYPRPKDLPLDQDGIELLSDVSPSDVAADIVSHKLVGTDPKLKPLYDKFVDGFMNTPKGQALLKEDYARAKQHGETRPMDVWAKTDRIPAYFRGRVFDQWKGQLSENDWKSKLAPEQLGLLDQMKAYVVGRGDNKSDGGGFFSELGSAFKRTIMRDNPQSMADALEMGSVLVREDSPAAAGAKIGEMVRPKGQPVAPIRENQDPLGDASKTIKDWIKKGDDGGQAAVPEVRDIRGLGDAAKWFGAAIGSAAGSSAPSVGTGLAAAAVTKNPVAGFFAGAFGPSYVQNSGDTYATLRDDPGVQAAIKSGKVTDKEIAGWAAVASVPIAALDAYGAEKLLPLKKLKGELMSRLIKRIVTGGLAEGGTEGFQQVLQEATLAAVGGDHTLAQATYNVFENFAQGTVGGTAISAATSPFEAGEEAPPVVPPAEELDVGAPGVDERMATDIPGAPQGTPPASAGPSPVSGATEAPRAAAAPAGASAAGNFDEDLLRETIGDVEEEVSKPGGEHLNEGDIRSPLPTESIREGKKLIDDLIGAPATEKPIRHVDEMPDIPPADLDEAAHMAATSPLNDIPQPTEDQKLAGNYRKGHMKVGGLDLAIENPQGSTREGVSSDGTPWSQEMKSHYGYVKGYMGRDKDHLDVFIKPGTDTNLADTAPIFVIDQVNEKGAFDETKTMIGYATKAEADKAYHENYAKGWDGAAAITPTTLGAYKDWLKNGNTKKPFGGEIVAEPAAQRALKKKIKANRERAPLDLVQFLASEGGLADHKGEVASLGMQKHFVPGIGKLMRGGGMALDRAREKAEEAGYIGKAGEYQTTTVADLLDAIDKNVRGQRVYAREDAGRAANRAAEKATTSSEGQARQAEFDQMMKDVGATLKPDEIKDVMSLIADGMWAEEAAIEVMERNALAREAEVEQSVGDDDVEGKSRARGETAEAGRKPAGEGARGNATPRSESGSGKQAGAAAKGPQKAELDRDIPFFSIRGPSEKTQAGEQSVLPGAEKISDKALAERKMQGAKKATVAQKDTEGLPLFGDDRKQLTMFQLRGLRRSVETPAFKKWFGDSKVVDANGDPLVIYHGTNQTIEQFDLKRGGAATGANAGATAGFFFTSSRSVADQYSLNAGRRVVSNIEKFEREQERLQKEVDRLEKQAQRTGNWDAYEKAMQAWEDLEIGATREDETVNANVVEAFMSLQNPKVIDLKGGRLTAARDMEAMIAEAKAEGRDGLIVENLEDSPQMGEVSTHYVAFSPTQIKSVNNAGTFSPTDPRIMAQVSRDGAAPSKVYHATSRANRDSILKAGLLRSKSEAAELSGEEGVGSIFASTLVEDGAAGRGLDIWEIDTQKLNARPDDTTDPTLDGDAWYAFDEDIPASALRLVPESEYAARGAPKAKVTSATLDADTGAFDIEEEDKGIKVRLQLTPAFVAKAATVQRDLRARLDKLGLPQVGVRVAEKIQMAVKGQLYDADGLQFQNLISIALDGENLTHTLNHEALHALRELGVFTDTEWAILSRKSNKEWRTKYDISKFYGNRSEGVQVEEGIAEALADWMNGAQMDGVIAKAFRKIKAALKGIYEALTGNDIRTAEDIFAQVASGKVGRRAGREGFRTEPMMQPAWHGTPHDFDRFSLEHMGKGEGAQAFGWGLYFAGKKAIAEYYRDTLSQKQAMSTMDMNDPRVRAMNAVNSVGEAKAIANFEDNISRFEKGSAPYERSLAALNAIKDGSYKEVVSPTGKLFKVDLPEDSELMDYDAPLSEQSPEVQEKLAKAGIGSVRQASEWKPYPGETDKPIIIDQYGSEIVDHGDYFSAFAMNNDTLRTTHVGDPKTLEKAKKLIEDQYAFERGITGRQAYNLLSSRLKSDKAASEALRAAGIPGHRFLDNTSRHLAGKWEVREVKGPMGETRYQPTEAKSGNTQQAFASRELAEQWIEKNKATHNYVIYDDSRISVEAKFQIRRDQTNTPEFKEWFAGSKVTQDGKPLVVHHGSRSAFTEFDPARAEVGIFGEGFYFSSNQTNAAAYGKTEPFYLSIKNPAPQNVLDQLLEEDVANDEIRGELESRGYDGAIVKTGDEQVFVAFEPEQIRSAAVEPGINARLRGLSGGIPPISTVTAPLSARMMQFIKSNKNVDEESMSAYAMRRIVDYLDPLKKLMDSVGQPIADAVNAYQQARLALDASVVRIMEMHGAYVDPMLDALTGVGATLEELHKYAYAKHAPERNRVVGLRNEPGSQFHNAVTDHDVKGASGMSTNEAKQILRDFQRIDPAKLAGIKEAHRLLRAMLEDSLDQQRADGLISTDQLTQLRAQWTNYVPMMGEEAMDETGDFSSPGRGSGFDVRGKEFKGATGRFTEAENAPAWAISLAERGHLRAEKNKIGKALLRFINQFGPQQGNDIADVYWTKGPGFGIIDKAPDVFKRELDKSGKVVSRKVPANTISPDMFATKVNGQNIYIKFKDAKVGMALKNMNAIELDFVSKLSRKLTNFQSLINTRANPAFIPTNFFRDALTGFVHLLDEGFSAVESAKVLANIPSAWAAIWRDARGKTGTSAADRAMAEWKKAGGKLIYAPHESIEDTIRGLQKKMKDRTATGLKPMAKVRFVLDLLGDINDTIENGVRLSAYMAARSKGRSVQDASLMARDLTVDFRKHGEIGPHMNSWFTFFNASVQGNFNVAARLAKSRKVQAAAMGIALSGFMMDLLNRSISGDDDDGENEYEKMLRNEPWKFERQMVIFYGPGKGSYFTIPMPYGYNALYHMGLQMSAAAHGTATPLEAMARSAHVAMDAFNPMGGGNLTSLSGVLTAFAPTIADPFLEIAFNKNFADAPIYPTKFPGDTTPDAYQSFSSTGAWAKSTAEWLNSFGGTYAESGALDVHPDTIEHIGSFVTGGLGRFFAQVGDAGQKIATGKFSEIEAENVPFVRSFFGRQDADNQKTEYYKIRESMQIYEGALKDYKDAHDFDMVKDLKSRYPIEAASAPAFDAAEKALRKIRKLKRRAEKSGDADKVKELSDRELEIMNRARTVYARNRQKESQ